MGLDALSIHEKTPSEIARENRQRIFNQHKLSEAAGRRMLLIDHLTQATKIVGNPQEGQKQAESINYLVDHISDLRELATEITTINQQLQHPILRALLSK